MITLIEQYDYPNKAGVLDDMFRLRARVFSEKLGWDVKVVHGRERDSYDDLNPVYMVALDRSGRKVIASARFLSTAGPTLLHDTFRDTMPDAVSFCSPTVWECTRFCVDEDRLLEEGCSLGAAQLSKLMLIGCGEFALRSGIEAIVANFDALMLRLYRQAGAEVSVLGRSTRFGSTPVYAGLFHISEEICDRMRARAEVHWPVLDNPNALGHQLAAAA